MFWFKKRRIEAKKQEFDNFISDYIGELNIAKQDLMKAAPGIQIFNGNQNFSDSNLFKSFVGSFVGQSGFITRGNTQGVESYFNSVYDYAAVYQIANTIAALPVKLFKMTNGVLEEVPRGSNMDAEKILTMPNPFTTWYDYIEGTVTFNELAGASFHEIVFPQSPKEIFLLRPDTVQVVTGKHGIKGFRINISGKSITLSSEEAFQIKYFNPLDLMRGFTPWMPMRQALSNDFWINQFMGSFFENGGHVAGVLTSQNPIQGEKIKDIQKQFDSKFAGASKAFKLLVLGGALTYTKTAVNPQEADMENLRKMTRLDILTGRGVPPILLGFLDGASYSNASVQFKTYYRNTIMPKSKKVEEGMTRHIFSKFGLIMKFDFSEVPELSENKLDNAKTSESMVKSGVYTINEVRSKSFGFEAVPNGEVIALPPQSGGMNLGTQDLMEKSGSFGPEMISFAKSNLLWKRRQLLKNSLNEN